MRNCVNGDNCQIDRYYDSGGIVALAGGLNTVHLSAQATNTYYLDSSAYASADPMIFFDPSFDHDG